MHLTQPIVTEFNRALTGMLLSLLCALVVFAAVSPFTFLDFSGYMGSITEQSDMVRGVADFPYTRQYRNTGLSYWVENFVFWATGPLLGVAALGGLALVLVRAARRTASAAELLLLAWVVPYAAITLSFQVKFLRYLVPLTPVLVLMGAYGLWRIAESRRTRIRVLPLVRYLPLALVLVGTALYALAFMQVYAQPLTRVSASEWIYRNIPVGAAVTDESWDDRLPLGLMLDGRGRSVDEYREVQMNLHEPDDARKLELLKGWLRQADYVIISSNRMYGWLPRLESRFPITKRYFDLLFAEKLGFSKAAEFTSYPRLGALEFNDDRADESFTVYDQLLGLAALPLALAVFHRFADGGYILAKSLGLLVVAYMVWLLASLHLVIQNALVIWVVTFIALAVSALVLLRWRAHIVKFVREHLALILIEEAFFTLAFLAFVFIRMLNPDLWQPWNGGEKTMEFAFLNAILKSPYFPPYDPYFAGGYINYYYYGIYLVSVLIKLTGVASEVAFNLAVPTLFALTSVNAFAVAYNVQASRAQGNMDRANSTSAISGIALLSGLCAAAFIAAIGNLDGFVQITEGFGKAANTDFHSGILGVDGLVHLILGAPAVLIEGKSLPPFDYWRSSRVIPFSINEFPLWSF
ncbi:MAG: DUF2298 domain-containing protein, partial [Chloroflexi bacterium]|nr:DUF2298 domain-containing protein [Chloroflexota bacterium]